MRARCTDFILCAVAMPTCSVGQSKSPSTPQLPFIILAANDRKPPALAFLKALRQASTEGPSVILTSHADNRAAVAAIKLSAWDYLLKPSSAEEIIDALVGPADTYLDAPETPVSVNQSQTSRFKEFLDVVA